jgi:4-alpha-glucanotransferase
MSTRSTSPDYERRDYQMSQLTTHMLETIREYVEEETDYDRRNIFALRVFYSKTQNGGRIDHVQIVLRRRWNPYMGDSHAPFDFYWTINFSTSHFYPTPEGSEHWIRVIGYNRPLAMHWNNRRIIARRAL